MASSLQQGPPTSPSQVTPTAEAWDLQDTQSATQASTRTQAWPFTEEHQANSEERPAVWGQQALSTQYTVLWNWRPSSSKAPGSRHSRLDAPLRPPSPALLGRLSALLLLPLPLCTPQSASWGPVL